MKIDSYAGRGNIVPPVLTRIISQVT